MKLPDDINPGIRRVVAILNAAGFETCDSGDGETHDYFCDREEGYVVVTFGETDSGNQLLDAADTIYSLLRRVGIKNFQVCANYDPADHLALIDINAVSDKDITVGFDQVVAYIEDEVGLSSKGHIFLKEVWDSPNASTYWRE